jgi:His-Xaa-Ser system radical SAM maturase HxsC
MLLRTKGKAQNIHEPIVGVITHDARSSEANRILISDGGVQVNEDQFLSVISTKPDSSGTKNPNVFGLKSTEHLHDGDIVSITQDGRVNTLFRPDSPHNFLLVTERCNSNCLMCSQPPRDIEDIQHYFDLYSKLIPLIPKDTPEIGITGGEPTLMGDLFFQLLRQIKTELPDTEVHVLTNGRSFAWESAAENYADLDFKRCMLGIPVYADYYQVHDYIVQAPNAFYQTIQGIHNLGKYNQRIEIRVVLHKQSIPRLAKLARYIYRNLPFVEHVTFMGLEITGFTKANLKDLWIDPYDYQDELTEAVEYLASKKMHVSIYNSQLCVIPERLWPFNRKSISDWKNIYLDDCKTCSKVEQCGGLFASGEKLHSEHIRAFE